MTSRDMNEAKVLLVEDDQGLAELLEAEIEDAGLTAKLAYTAEEGLALAASWMPDIIVSDLRLPGANGLELLRNAQTEIPESTPDFLIITAFGSVAKAVESLKAGAEDFLTKPLDLEHFVLTVERILEKRRMREQITRLQKSMDVDSKFHGMYGRSRCMLTLFQQIRQVAKASGPVLILGESGTGKELVARAIHRESKPEAAPFIAVNCAGIPEQLLESEFFGHEQGSFTGAGKARQGLFAEAEGGTLLLDEISEMPAALQAKLLRMLQDGKIRPVGSNREQQVNVRILAATNQNIDEQVASGDFREDLFYRLETFPLSVPPLRDREEDIDLLASIFLNKHAAATGKRIKGFSQRSLDMLNNYRFPGNVRELQNSIERAVAFCQTDEIRPENLPRRIQVSYDQTNSRTNSNLLETMQISDESLPPLKDVEQRYIQHVLKKVNDNKKSAASILGIARRTLYRHLDNMDRD